MITGTDVDYGALTHLLVSQLQAQPGFSVHYKHKVTGLSQLTDGRWAVTVEDLDTRGKQTGFPVSGIWLRCDVDEVSARHHAKVYGKAAEGSPPMSVPHLDTRIIDGKRSLLFGPYAGFSSKFLKHSHYSDLFRSIEPGNVRPMLPVAHDDWGPAAVGAGAGASISDKAAQWSDVVKIGRTHLQDAVPLTVGQEWSGSAHQLSQATGRVKASAAGLYELAAGGTAARRSAPGSMPRPVFRGADRRGRSPPRPATRSSRRPASSPRRAVLTPWWAPRPGCAASRCR